jgi:hypothetical protein
VRTLLGDGDGRVLERSHTLDVAAVPAEALREAARRGGGEVLAVATVQGPGGAEWLRCTVRGADGATREVELR